MDTVECSNASTPRSAKRRILYPVWSLFGPTNHFNSRLFAGECPFFDKSTSFVIYCFSIYREDHCFPIRRKFKENFSFFSMFSVRWEYLLENNRRFVFDVRLAWSALWRSWWTWLWVSLTLKRIFSYFVLWNCVIGHFQSAFTSSFAWFRSLSVWKHCMNYFPIDLVKTENMPAGRNYLLCCFPHGLFVWVLFGISNRNPVSCSRFSSFTYTECLMKYFFKYTVCVIKHFSLNEKKISSKFENRIKIVLIFLSALGLPEILQQITANGQHYSRVSVQNSPLSNVI